MSFFPPLSIADAIDKIDYNQYLLPAIQRDFVWSSGKIEMLFDSLMQQYPIGSMLLWRVEGNNTQNQRFYGILKKYRERFLNRSEEVDTKKLPSFEVVLDGQQRLTALYLGLKGSYAYHEYNLAWKDNEHSIPTRYLYLNLKYKKDSSKDLNDSDDDRKYEFLFLKPSEAKNEDGNKWFKVGDILGIRGMAQLNSYCKKHEIEDQDAQEILSRLHDIVHLEKLIHYYLEKGSDFTRALDIFIRINSGGINLSYSDLVMSTTISGWMILDARKEINGLVDEIVKEYGFAVNKDLILRTYLILYNDDIKFRVTNFSIKNAKDFESKWENIRKAIKEVFQLIVDFGYAPKTLTSLNAVLPIIYYLYKTDKVKDFHKKVAYKDDRAIIKKWLHVVLLHQIFGGQAEGVLKAIRDTLKKEIAKSPAVFPAAAIAKRLSKTNKSINVDKEFVENLLYTQKENRYAFPILALLYPNLKYKDGDFNLDHCHPISNFNEKKLKLNNIQLTDSNREYFTDPEYFNSIINLQMLDGNENKSKGAKQLADWVSTNKINKKKYYFPNDLNFSSFDKFAKQRQVILTVKLMEELKF
ncbi:MULTISPECIES: DUF262 domain-containing protein [Chryseobacterium group]|jgi:uncharacterized protein with ParB-like and HNH nuclease domain|uniref:DUF262 domain-containing protein n=4 Tax=Chryseobacterium TaxID=59732 RepID=A0AAJ1R6S0_9FLAO|nr:MULTISPECIES: DUF262 domain-containing protein [Chryseobacterium group]EFK33228.1 hypothetical protein HMPREF0204_12296 [Chryseobacterium gleum ATCC 35910]MDN4013317.1 DUF262 domain-containing protein [Chryseobacterium gambrini]MDN4028829.1 DUF262 domain-containing protein [Chryseobacterium gambrini]QQY34031.1 DUF262 domain-containing protein [Chryseobacterium gleum]QWA40108.1 DUF262 domain-containing protein [Chryseobacterium sp. ZHDP1]